MKIDDGARDLAGSRRPSRTKTPRKIIPKEGLEERREEKKGSTSSRGKDAMGTDETHALLQWKQRSSAHDS